MVTGWKKQGEKLFIRLAESIKLINLTRFHESNWLLFLEMKRHRIPFRYQFPWTLGIITALEFLESSQNFKNLSLFSVILH